jgi:hypothetical protein
VKYVKHNALYGESFSDWTELEEYLAVWLEKTANVRIHGTTGKVPRQVYDEEEHSAMRAYFPPLFVKDEISETPSRRKVDKTGLLSWCSNKYSVPMPYQQAIVGVEQVGENLYVTDLGTGSRIAEHVICHEKGRIIKNNNHYRDHEKHVRDFEAQVKEQLEEPLGSRICSLLKATSPQIYKDQLAGLIKILSRHDEVNLDVMEKLSQRPRLTATMIRDYLEAYSLSEETPASRPVSSDTARDLARYAKLTTANGGCYVVH